MRRVLHHYGFFALLRLARDLAASAYVSFRLKASGIAFFRLPLYIRGGRFIRIGKKFTSGVGLRLDAFWSGETPPLIQIGDFVEMNDYVHIACISRVTIGDNVLIASKVFITDHNHGNYGPEAATASDPRVPPRSRRLQSAPVTIEENVWLGEYVTILPGVTIGRGSVIGSMSVVTRDIPPYTIAVGAPARPQKTYDFTCGAWRSTGAAEATE
ncbi:MAG TPA: DapH/DapD/GlmU-related protein [Dehalococcoidia bacterium]